MIKPMQELFAWSSTEKTVAAIWSEALGFHVTGLDEDFFDLGGHSLLVARLQQRFKSTFGHAVTMASLFHAPTIRGHAAVLDSLLGSRRALPAGILLLQSAGSGPILFWFHPTPLVKNLVRGLHDQPLAACVLTPEDMERLGARPAMEQIAACHMETILRAQPNGPFYLGGYCVGGVVAFAVAERLVAAGLSVELVVLLDSQNPAFYRKVERLAVELNKARFYLGRAFRSSKPLRSLFGRGADRLRALFLTGAALNNEMRSAERLTDLAAAAYRPKPYTGRVLLLQPRERPTSVNYGPGWKTVVGHGLEVEDVPGHHDELLAQPNASSVASTVAARVRDQEALRVQSIDRRLKPIA